MDVSRVVVGPLRTNCYILEDEGKAAIIDPGADPDRIIELIEKRCAKAEVILATHGHFDHILAVNSLRKVLGIRFLISGKDMFLVEKLPETVERYLGIGGERAPRPDGYLEHGMQIPVGGEVLSVIETPGHTPGSCTFRAGSFLFTGDFLFRGSIGRTDMGGSLSEMRSSLDSIKRYDDDLRVYPGHGPETVLGREKVENPFLIDR